MDYTNKYGLGYELTNGCTAVYFNDATSLMLSDDGSIIDYMYYPDHKAGRSKDFVTSERYTKTHHPRDLRKKVTLLGCFQDYMRNNLFQPSRFKTTMTPDVAPIYINRWSRGNKGILFRMSHRVIQINFFDHYKLLLSDEGRIVTLINVKREIKTWKLSQALNEKEIAVIDGRRVERDAVITEKLLLARQHLATMVGEQE